MDFLFPMQKAIKSPRDKDSDLINSRALRPAPDGDPSLPPSACSQRTSAADGISALSSTPEPWGTAEGTGR